MPNGQSTIAPRDLDASAGGDHDLVDDDRRCRLHLNAIGAGRNLDGIAVNQTAADLVAGGVENAERRLHGRGNGLTEIGCPRGVEVLTIAEVRPLAELGLQRVVLYREADDVDPRVYALSG